MGFTVNKV